MLLKCLCWVGGSQGVPFLTFTPNSYGRKVRIAKTQPQVGKEAPHFAVLSINIWPGNSFCEHNPVVSASEFFWLLGTAALKSWQAWIVASLPVSLKKKYGEQMIAGMFFMKSSSQATRWTLKDAPRCLYPQTISECLLFTLLEWKLFNHCLCICFNLETVNLLAHNVPGASPCLSTGQLEHMEVMILEKSNCCEERLMQRHNVIRMQKERFCTQRHGPCFTLSGARLCKCSPIITSRMWVTLAGALTLKRLVKGLFIKYRKLHIAGDFSTPIFFGSFF